MKNPISKKDKKKSSYRVLRGGRWSLKPGYIRAASRSYVTPSGRYVSYGLRIVRTKKE